MVFFRTCNHLYYPSSTTFDNQFQAIGLNERFLNEVSLLLRTALAIAGLCISSVPDLHFFVYMIKLTIRMAAKNAICVSLDKNYVNASR